MFQKSMKSIMALPLVIHLAASGTSIAVFQFVKAQLDASYAASKYPVDFATGQLAFNHTLLEGYYTTMINAGTLNVYWQTQFIDFGFIAMVAITGTLLGTLVARFGVEGTRVRALGKLAAFAAVLGASFDVLENLFSFILLQTPTSISQSWVLFYSSAAVLKFAGMSLAMILVATTLLLASVQYFFKILRRWR
jgi:hypothetical protein